LTKTACLENACSQAGTLSLRRSSQDRTDLKKLRVAYFTDTYHPQVNGLVTSIDSNREELARLGHEVLVFAPNLPGQAPAENVHRLGGIVYYPQPEYTFVLPWGKGFSLRAFEKFKVDLIHGHGVWGAWIAAWITARRKNLPLVLTYHTFFELYLHYFPLPKALLFPLNALFTRVICNACDLVIAPTKIIKRALVGYGATCRIEVLPTGLTKDVFKRSGSKKIRYAVPKNALFLSSAGRLGSEKNFEILFQALALAKPRLGNFRLLIAGDGPQRKAYEKLVLRLGLGKEVVFLGYVTRHEVLDLLEASDLFVFPSVTETQGMVLLEAMGRGTPVIAADALGPSEILASGKGGWLAKPNDAADLAAKLLAALKPAARAKKAREAVVLAKTFAADKINQRLVKLYDEVLSAAATKAL
jgi:glycosyltransferase involved in cell wall biosynthesis